MYYPYSNIAVYRKDGVLLYFTDEEIRNMDKIILIIRDPIKSYISTFFQSIHNQSYEYYQNPNNKLEKIYENFIKFPWTKYHHCNFHFHYEYIKNIFKDCNNLNVYDKNKKYNEYLNGKIIILPITSVNEYFNIKQRTNLNKTELYKQFINNYQLQIHNKFKNIYSNNTVKMFIENSE